MTLPSSDTAAGPGQEADELSRTRVRMEAALHDRRLALEARRRLESEIVVLEQRIAELTSERDAAQARLDERMRYITALHGSAAWRLIQALRGLVGRRW